jgi:hypothetical protein
MGWDCVELRPLTDPLSMPQIRSSHPAARRSPLYGPHIFLGFLHALAWAKNTLRARPCLSVCLSVAFSLGGRQPTWPGLIVAQIGTEVPLLEHSLVQQWPWITLVQQWPTWHNVKNTFGSSVYSKEYLSNLVYCVTLYDEKQLPGIRKYVLSMLSVFGTWCLSLWTCVQLNVECQIKN